MIKRIYSGKWAGLSVKTISKLLGITYGRTYYLLNKNYEKEKMTLEEIGDLIHKVKSNNHSNLMDLLDKELRF